MATDTEETYYLSDLEKLAKEEFDGYLEDLKGSQSRPEDDVIDEKINEIAQSYVPSYNGALLRYALNNLWIACEEPEMLAHSGESTAVNAIAGVMCEHLEGELREYWEGKSDDFWAAFMGPQEEVTDDEDEVKRPYRTVEVEGDNYQGVRLAWDYHVHSEGKTEEEVIEAALEFVREDGVLSGELKVLEVYDEQDDGKVSLKVED